MKSFSLLNVAAVIATITVLAITFVLVPEAQWSAITIVTAIGFAVSVGFVFYIPSIFRKKRPGTDAQQIAAIGPVAISSFLLLFTMSTSFILSLVDFQKLGLALLIFSIGAFIVTNLLLSASLNIVSEISNKTSQPSNHINWQGQVAIFISQATNNETISELQKLSEKLRYSASDVCGGSSLDIKIENILSAMSADLETNPDTNLADKITEMNRLLTQRDVYLKSVRSKA